MTTPDQPAVELLDLIRRYGARRVNQEVVPNDRNAAALREVIDLIEARINLGRAESFQHGVAEGLKRATTAVRAQAGLPDLVHFDRPSDFRKGVLTCLAALEASAGRSAEQDGADAHMAAMEERHQREAEQDGADRG